MAKIIAVANQKGGVGKTTTSINLAASLAHGRQRVLLVDMDPQGNATMGCGVDKGRVEHTACSLLLGEADVDKVIRTLPDLGFDLVPANADLTAAEVELIQALQREKRLSVALAPCLARYDFLLIDCPPSLNMLTVNALVAADSVLIPVQCEYFALEGLSALMDTIAKIRQWINPGLKVEGVLRTMYDARSRLAREVSEQLLAHFPGQVFHTLIPRNIRLAEAPSHGLPVAYYDKSSRGARAYQELAGELTHEPTEVV